MLQRNLPTPIEAAAASLPATYQAAKTALADCAKLDECQDWADKAAALASYAKQANDDELMKMATRIRDRAIRRAGELLKQIEPAKGGRPSETGIAADTGFSRKDAADEAGMSKRQAVTAIRVANVPAADFASKKNTRGTSTSVSSARRSQMPLDRFTISTAIRRWMAGLPLSPSESTIVDAALRFNAGEQFARCQEGSP